MKVLKNTFAAITVALVALMMTASFASAAVSASDLEALGFSEAQISALMLLISTPTTTTATTTSSTPFNWNGSLIKFGSKGAQVSSLQTCMNKLGFSTGIADGIYGNNTKSGIVAFQNSKGLTPDGIVGKMTAPAFEAACNVEVAPTAPTTTTPSVVSNGGTEASLESFKLSSEDDAEEGKDAHVATIEFDVEDGDVVIERADFTFTHVAAGTADTRPWKVFEEIVLMADGKEIGSMDIDSKSDWRVDATPFEVRLSGMNYVVEDGDTAEIEVYLTANGNVEDNANAKWTISVKAEAIRGTDSAGITQETGDNGKSVTFDVDAEGGDEALKLKASSNDPKESLLKVETNKVSDDHKVFVFRLEAEENDIDVDVINLALTTAGKSYNDMVDDIWLEIDGDKYNDETVTGGAAIGATTISFDIDEKLTLDADTTEDVTVYVKLKKQSSLATTSTMKFATVSATGLGVDDVTASAGINGYLHTLSLTAIEISNVASSVTEGGATAGIIDFTFKVTADDEDITLAIADVLSTNGAANTAAVAAGVLSKVSGTATEAPAGTFTILAGNSATLRARYNVSGTAGQQAEVKVNTIKSVDVDVLSPTLILKV